MARVEHRGGHIDHRRDLLPLLTDATVVDGLGEEPEDVGRHGTTERVKLGDGCCQEVANRGDADLLADPVVEYRAVLPVVGKPHVVELDLAHPGCARLDRQIQGVGLSHRIGRIEEVLPVVGIGRAGDTCPTPQGRVPG